MDNSVIIVVGATGHLGGLVVQALLARQAQVRALVRRGTQSAKLEKLRKSGVKVIELDFNNAFDLAKACVGGTCVVSTLAGLREVIIDTQTALLNAAVKAGVPRFIPSDFALDFMKMPGGFNRNLDLRREFHAILAKSPIAVTSILNGGFMDILIFQAPIILYKLKRILYWQNADQRLDFTTIENTAEFTAEAALDPTTPRTLRIAGEQISPRELAALVSQMSGQEFTLLRAGSLTMLETIIKVLRFFKPAKDQLYPLWQSMQYMQNMFTGRAQLTSLDNTRYPAIKWTTARDALVRIL